MSEKQVDDKEQRVRLMAGEYHDKKTRFEMMGMMGIKYDRKERREQEIEYEVARAEMVEAEKNLRISQGLQ